MARRAWSARARDALTLAAHDSQWNSIDQTTTGTMANEIRQEPPVHPGADRSKARPTLSLELAMRVKQE